MKMKNKGNTHNTGKKERKKKRKKKRGKKREAKKEEESLTQERRV